jgi:hypothetical protein
VFCTSRNFKFYLCRWFLIIVVGTLGMIIPASGGIGAFNLAMKYGFMAFSFQWEKAVNWEAK